MGEGDPVCDGPIAGEGGSICDKRAEWEGGEVCPVGRVVQVVQVVNEVAVL